MARTIADGEVRMSWVTGGISDINAPTQAECNGGTDITPFLSSLDTPLDGDAPDSSDLASAFNKSVAGTYGGGATGTFYRDDTADTAWDAFPRLTSGHLVIRRFGGSGVTFSTSQTVEVWPLRVITRSPATMDRNSVQTFTVDFATTEEPDVDSTVAA
jgi:hypothetical protein